MQRILFSLIICLLAISNICFGVGLPPNTHIQITATADYTNVYNEPQSAYPASVTLTVLQIVGSTITWETPTDVVAQGSDVYVPLRITNIGNGEDTFDLTISSSHGWDTAIVYDDNADSVHQQAEQWAITDTSLMLADGYTSCFARVSVPADAVTGDTLTITSTSRTNPSQGVASVNVDVAAPGMKATKINLTSTPDTPVIGQKITVNGVIEPAVSLPIAVTVTDPASQSTTYNCTSAADGSFNTEFTTNQTGTYKVQAAFAGDSSYTTSNATKDITVAAKTVSSIALEVVPVNPTAGSTVAIKGNLIPAQSTALALTCTSPSGTSTQINTNTDEYGSFCASTVLDTAGQWTIAAAYSGSETVAVANGSLSVTVQTAKAAHDITMSTAPAASPLTVTWPETTQCSAAATDSSGHTVTYQWSDGAAGGTFTPSANIASPTYMPSANTTSQDKTITLTCTATCSEDTTIAAVANVTLINRPVDNNKPTVLAVSPQVNATLTDLGADIVIRFSKAMNQSATQQAISISPSVTFSSFTWDSTGTILTISHPSLSVNTTYTCTISTVAKDTLNQSMLAQYRWAFSTVSKYRFDPADIGAAPSVQFSTPRILVNDPSQPTNVTFRIGIPSGLVVNTNLDNGSLACVIKGADAGTLTSTWNSSSREILVNAEIANPSLSAEVIKAIRLTSPATAGNLQISTEGVAALTVRVRDLIPGDFNGDGVVSIDDAIRFTQEWVRWNIDIPPAWDQDIDEPFDLAPHTEGVWPNWTIIGDHIIDSLDAAAFNEAWTASHVASASPASLNYKHSTRSKLCKVNASGKLLSVNVEKSVDGLFEAVVEIPSNTKFDSALDSSGNLASVSRGKDAKGLFYSEYDPTTRTVRIIGAASSKGSQNIAAIHLLK